MTYFAGINPSHRIPGDWGFKNIPSVSYQGQNLFPGKEKITYRKVRCDGPVHKAVLGHIELGSDHGWWR